jgi:FkbM family methyltransferase
MTSTGAPTVCRLLIPARNEAARIVRCLESVRASYLPAGFEWAEWAVLDDDSTDGTAQSAESWAASRSLTSLRVVRAPRRGKSAALGEYHATLIAQGHLGHLVVVLDADTALAPGALDSLLRAFAQDPSLGVAWGMDQIDSRGVGHWASAYQMEAVMALAHRHGKNAPRAYGRFFAYRVSALADFCWQAGFIVDDTQLAHFVREHSVPARTVEEARVLATPAASSHDFHLQTQRSIAARTRMSGGRRPERDAPSTWRTAALDKVAAAAITAGRHPLWAVAYATTRAASSARQRLSPTSFSDLWVPPATTKQAIEARSAPRSGPARVLAVAQRKFGGASNACRFLRNWPAVLGRVALSWLGYGGGVFTVETRSGLRVQAPGDPQARTPLLEVLSDDVYRLGSIDWASAGPAIVLDIGAHVGSFTCALAQRAGLARFVCVEPSPVTSDWLARNLEANKLSERVTIVRAAVASTDGEGTLWEAGDASGESSTIKGKGRPVPVRTVSLESLVSCAGGPPDVVKLDCEGGEYDAILSSPDWCWKQVRYLFLEHHPVAGHCFDELVNRLHCLGFEPLWHTLGSTPGLGMACFARVQPGVELGLAQEGPGPMAALGGP